MKRNKKIVIIFIFLIALIAMTIIGNSIGKNKKDVKEENSSITQNEKIKMVPLPEQDNNPVEITEINSLAK